MASDGVIRIIYAESVRNLERQAVTLDGLRERAGTLLAAAALVTAFLAPPALKVSESSTRASFHFGLLAWLATGAFVGVVLTSLGVLLPKSWVFGHGAWDLLDKFVEAKPPRDEVELQYHLAYYNEEYHEANAKKIGWLFLVFAAGCALLAAEVGFWLAAVVH
jgi:hypothetical protein